MRKLLVAVLVLLLWITLPGIGWGAEQDYFPTDTWRTSTPEAQGMDSEKLDRMLKYIKTEQKNLHSILIIRNGYLIHETYFYPYQRSSKQDICSCTKSFVSALVGIALNEGKIQSLDQKVLDFFQEVPIRNQDPRLQKLTIRHLLTMTTGMEWDEDGDSLNGMYRSKDWVEYILNTKLEVEPGQKFNYNSGATHLLSAILQKVTGVSTLDYAKEKLFTPLNISYGWAKDPDGITVGYARLTINPTEMAKFGYLYLKNGKWNDQQLVAPDWIATSTQKQVRAYPSVDYGFQWWMKSFDGYSARGWGGQYIYVLPKYNMVVVVTSGGVDFDDLMEYFVLPAVKGVKPLPLNPKTNNQIKTLAQQFEYPQPQAIKPLPKVAHQISGKVFKLEPNNFGCQSWTFTFKDNQTCTLKVDFGENSLELPVGLDGMYRPGKSFYEQSQVMCRGSWVTDHEFMLDWQEMVWPEHYRFDFDFRDKQVTIFCQGSVEQGINNFVKGKMVQ